VEPLECPHCRSTKVVKNGLTYYGKQNHRCRHCKRQFVERQPKKVFTTEQVMEHLLVERVSLRGICRVLSVSMGWLTARVQRLWAEQAYDLPIGKLSAAQIKLFAIEADEMWSFVGNKTVQQWIWLAIERRTGLVVGYYIGDRSEKSARYLWLSIDPALRAKSLFFSDDWDAYGAVIPAGQHTRGKADTPIIERFNNTLRQRCSRLVGKTLSFSKSVENHYQAILFFLRHHNLAILTTDPSL